MTGTATVQAADGVDVMVTEQFRDRGSASGGHRPLCKLVRIKLCMTVGRCRDRDGILLLVNAGTQYIFKNDALSVVHLGKIKHA